MRRAGAGLGRRQAVGRKQFTVANCSVADNAAMFRVGLGVAIR
ncbi:MAG: hypothetical protein ACK6DS_18850 [Planctomycetota bacterium]